MFKRWTLRRVHLWTAVVVGVALTFWLLSGVVMMGSHPTAAGMTSTRPMPLNSLADALVSPSEAVVAVGGDPATIRSMRIEPVGDWWTYWFRVGRADYVINAATGQPIVVDAEAAQGLAAGWMRPDIAVTNVSRISEHDLWYFRGGLPVFRVQFDNGTVGHVDTKSGAVALTDGQRLFYDYFVTLHTFSTIGVLVRLGGSDPLLIAASVLALVVIVTGYLMMYPQVRSWLRNRRAAG